MSFPAQIKGKKFSSVMEKVYPWLHERLFKKKKKKKEEQQP